MPLSREQRSGDEASPNSTKLETNSSTESSVGSELGCESAGSSTRITLEVGESSSEWTNKKLTPKRYTLECLETERAVLVNFSEFSSKQVTKSLLDDIYSLAGVLEAEELIVTISPLNSEGSKILRSLYVFGFEREEGKKFGSGEIVVRIDVNQEYDYVDTL